MVRSHGSLEPKKISRAEKEILAVESDEEEQIFPIGKNKGF